MNLKNDFLFFDGAPVMQRKYIESYHFMSRPRLHQVIVIVWVRWIADILLRLLEEMISVQTKHVREKRAERSKNPFVADTNGIFNDSL